MAKRPSKAFKPGEALKQPKFAGILPEGFIGRSKNPELVRELLSEIPVEHPRRMENAVVHTSEGPVRWSEIRRILRLIHTWATPPPLGKRAERSSRRVEMFARIRNRLIAAQRLFRFYQETVEAHNNIVNQYGTGSKKAGEHTEALARARGLDPSTIREWARGKYVPTPISRKQLLSHRRPVNIEMEHTDPRRYAYFLGTVLTSRPIQSKKDGKSVLFESEYKSKGVRDEVARTLRLLTGDKVKTWKEHGLYCVRYFNKSFLQHFNRITRYGRVVPRESMRSPEQKRLLLRAAFDQKGFVGGGNKKSVPDAPMYVDTAKNEAVFSYISELLNELGITHIVARGKNAYTLKVHAHKLELFNELIGFRSKRYQKDLESVIERRRIVRKRAPQQSKGRKK